MFGRMIWWAFFGSTFFLKTKIYLLGIYFAKDDTISYTLNHFSKKSSCSHKAIRIICSVISFISCFFLILIVNEKLHVNMYSRS